MKHKVAMYVGVMGFLLAQSIVIVAFICFNHGEGRMPSKCSMIDVYLCTGPWSPESVYKVNEETVIGHALEKRASKTYQFNAGELQVCIENYPTGVHEALRGLPPEIRRNYAVAMDRLGAFSDSNFTRTSNTVYKVTEMFGEKLPSIVYTMGGGPKMEILYYDDTVYCIEEDFHEHRGGVLKRDWEGTDLYEQTKDLKLRELPEGMAPHVCCTSFYKTYIGKLLCHVVAEITYAENSEVGLVSFVPIGMCEYGIRDYCSYKLLFNDEVWYVTFQTDPFEYSIYDGNKKLIKVGTTGKEFEELW